MKLRSIAVLVAMCLLPPVAEAAAKPRVVATILPLADIVAQLAGDAVEVVTLLPPGASPHTFEPTPAQMRDLADARLVIRVGAGLDDWALRLLSAASAAPTVVTLTEGLDLLVDADEHHGSNGDPHIWLDPLLVRDQSLPRLLAALQSLEGLSKESLQQRHGEFRDRLTRLDGEIRAALEGARIRKFIAFHSAWRYFARRYDLEQLATVEDSPGKEPSARSVAQLITLARHNGVKSMLVEPQFSPRLAEQLVGEFGGKIVLTDPIGNQSVAERARYLDLMRFNAKAFAEALR